MSDDEHDGVAQQLLAALERGGRFVDEGGFTLDPSKAREKLRAYQLVDPHGYLLLVVEAAWLAGPAAIDISCGRTSVAEFDGISLTRSQLENVFTSVFLDTDELDGAALIAARIQQLLGVAANAALALAPVRIEIDNVDAEGRRNRMTVVDDGRYECVALGEDQPGRTRFVFVGERDDQRDDHEVALIRERCRYASFPISLYGQRMSAGPRRAMFGAKTERIRLADGATIGLAGQTEERFEARLLLLTRGVLSETIPLKNFPRGFVAVADADLRKDLSQQGVMRGPGFDAVMTAVGRARELLR